MSLTTANKRRSAFGLDGPTFIIGPLPDGSLASMPDARHLAGCYRFAELGALTETDNKRRSVFGLDGPVFVVPPGPDGSLSSRQDRRHLSGHYRFDDQNVNARHVVAVRYKEARYIVPRKDTRYEN